MKRILLLALLSALVETSFGAGSEAIIRQRAKDLSNQNNVRQGVPPSYPPAQPPAANNAAAAPRSNLTPQQQALLRLQNDLAAIKPNAPVATEQKQKLAASLLALTQSGKKPDASVANKLAADIASTLSQKTLPEATRSRLAQDLYAVFNPANVPAAQMQEIVSDVQAIFQTIGLNRKEAVTISDQTKAIAADLQKAK